MTQALNGVVSQQVTFDYNPASQIVLRNASNDAYAWSRPNPVERGYARNGLNQYDSTSGTSGASYGYDGNGNLTAVTPAAPDLETRLRYDSENRLVHAEGAKSADLEYDPLGRLWRVSGGAAGATRFYYDGDKLVFEMSDGGALRHFYVHGDGVDQPLAWWDFTGANTRRFLHADQQGSIVAVSNGQTGAIVMVGTVPAINSYDPWGVPGANNMPGLRFGYTGQAWIPELGMYYYKARFYWPMLGRFLQVDPIGYDGGANLYAYVGSDPVNGTDSTGLLTEPPSVGHNSASFGEMLAEETPTVARAAIGAVARLGGALVALAWSTSAGGEINAEAYRLLRLANIESSKRGKSSAF